MFRLEISFTYEVEKEVFEVSLYESLYNFILDDLRDDYIIVNDKPIKEDNKAYNENMEVVFKFGDKYFFNEIKEKIYKITKV